MPPALNIPSSLEHSSFYTTTINTAATKVSKHNFDVSYQNNVLKFTDFYLFSYFRNLRVLETLSINYNG